MRAVMRKIIIAALLALSPALAFAQTAVTGPTGSTPGDLATFGNGQGNAIVDTPIIGVPHGGTAQSTLPAHGVLLGQGQSGVTAAVPSSPGQLLIDQGPGNDPAFRPVSGAITINSSGVASAVSGFTGCTQFAGNGNGVTDNTATLNSALAALSGTGGCIFFTPGKYRFNSGISYSLPAGIFSVTLVGGGQDNTILYWPNASGGITFNYAGISSSVHVRDLSLTTGTTNGGSAVTLNLSTSVANPAVTAISDFYRVTMRGDDGYVVTDYWTNCVNVANVSNIQWDNLSCFGAATPNGNGINLVGLPGSSTYGVVYNIAKSTFNNLKQDGALTASATFPPPSRSAAG
jgi:hypothetical protein